MSEEAWAFCAPYLTLMKEDAPQREHPLRELYNGLRWFVRAGCPWRMMPNDLPPWHAVQQQTQRWVRTGCFETMAEDLRALLRLAAQRDSVPTAVILDSRTLQSTPESGGRAGYDGAKKRKGSKVHAAVDSLGHLLAVKVTAANEQDRAQVKDLAQAVQSATGENVQLAYVDQGSRASNPQETRRNTASNSKWSNIRKPNADLCCCPGVGWWSVPSRGRRVSADWPATTNGSRLPWPVIIGSPCHAHAQIGFRQKSMTGSSDRTVSCRVS